MRNLLCRCRCYLLNLIWDRYQGKAEVTGERKLEVKKVVWQVQVVVIYIVVRIQDTLVCFLSSYGS
jgi:hypothetical protein